MINIIKVILKRVSLNLIINYGVPTLSQRCFKTKENVQTPNKFIYNTIFLFISSLFLSTNLPTSSPSLSNQTQSLINYTIAKL